MESVVRLIAICVLSVVYGIAMLVSKFFKMVYGSKWKPAGKILVIGTFHNPNWFYSHITPLSRSGVGEVVLVCDEPVASMDNVHYECPPRLLAKICSRAGAKFLWAIVCGFRHRPDLYMGYHIFPAAVSALIVARLFNRPACYQCTSGPLELEGGGWHAENPLLVALSKPSRIVERSVFAVVRQFDLVVVRGNKAKDFICDFGYKNKIKIITGSVNFEPDMLALGQREYDIVFVGRLAEYKRPDRFVTILGQIVRSFPHLKAIMLGDGPDRESLLEQIRELGIEKNIQLLGRRKDVLEFLKKSKIFLLTSRWEGLSIAMLEAMSVGTVPVVADVGDLKDIVVYGENGFVVNEDSIDEFSQKIIQLMSDELLWEKLSKYAYKAAVNYSSVNVISKLWNEELSEVVRLYSER